MENCRVQKVVFCVLIISVVLVGGLQVEFHNQRSSPLYVSFTGSASWGASCSPPFRPGTACTAQVGDVGTTRFCASTKTTEDCNNAQNLHLTLIETAFVNDVVWVDLSVIPAACTNADWYSNRCANTGGASYNVPIQIQCNTGTVYCRGNKGADGYPTNCGNPTGGCVGQDNGNCVQAYFFPAPPKQPVLVCSYMNVTFFDN